MVFKAAAVLLLVSLAGALASEPTGAAEHSAPVGAPTESINFVALDRQQQTLGAGAPAPGLAQQQVQRVFAVFGDWGRQGGDGSQFYQGKVYQDNAKGACPETPQTPFFVTLSGDLRTDPLGGGKDSPCVVAACGNLTDPTDGSISSQQEECIGTIQQYQAATLLNNTCAARGGCEFIINTSDNFYTNGCNSTAGDQGGNCAERFQEAWTNMYQIPAMSAIKGLTWYASLGNHDMLGGTEGVNAQIAFSQMDSKWYLPARYYATTIGSGPTAINLVVFNSDPLIDGYKVVSPSNSYGLVDEMIATATDAARTQQLDFIESALQKASSLPGWTVLMGHHPAFSGDESYFIEDDTGLPESSAWARLANLTKQYKPVAMFAGHDHVVSYMWDDNFDTAFFISGAGSFSEPNDGGWNISSNSAKTGKPYLKYSNVKMQGGASHVGNIICTVTDTVFKAEIFSGDTGVDPQWITSCTRNSSSGYICMGMPGTVAQPNYAPFGNSTMINGAPVAAS